MDKAGIEVILGTPTYAIPTSLAREHPDVLVVTPKGPAEYGRRQNMDITNPAFRDAAQQVIVALVDHVKDHPSVIGYQLDNETKAYETSGPNVQAAFVKSMRRHFPDLAAMNKEFGLDYWSNRVNDWAALPSVNGSINASASSAFAEFQRGLVTDYLAWQAALVRDHARKGQFVAQNFDLDWRGYSYGIQPAVDHFAAARALDVAGIDIYHLTQDHLTGAEIAFGGDLARSIRRGQNYLVIETEAQGFPEWTPYPGQLRLQAFSHLASGANMVEYWHWGTTSNAVETYWRGLLSQDFRPNPTFDEAGSIGKDLARLGPQLVNMCKQNRIAIYVSNRALTAFNSFKFGWTSTTTYNNVLRPFYDALFRMNAEVDFVDPSTTDLSAYKLILVPALSAASDGEIERLNAFAKAGGHLLYTFKSGFSDENVKVRSTTMAKHLSVPTTGVSDLKFSELADRWEKVHDRKLKPSTFIHYRNTLRSLRAEFGEHQVASITKHEVDSFLLDKASSYSKSSVRSMKTTLQIVLGWAADNSWVSSNVAKGIKLSRSYGGRTVTRNVLTSEQVNNLASELSEPFSTLVVLLYSTGLRIGEAAGIRFGDIDANILHVKRRVYGGKVDDLKTKGSQRKLPLSSELVARLQTLRTEGSDGFVFQCRNGGLLNPGNWLRREIRPAAKKLDITLSGWHDFRVSLSTNLRRQGTHPKLVSSILGHSRVQLALDTYDLASTEELTAPLASITKELNPNEPKSQSAA